MRLHLARSQADAKGLLGGNKGVNFQTRARIALDADEEVLFRRCRLDGFAVKVIRGVDKNGGKVHYSARDVVTGIVRESKNVEDVLGFEYEMKECCRDLRAWLQVARTFDGEVVWDPDADD
jgi:hypothetical protein